jgi:serine/threonine-protein kinase RsbT
MCQDAKMTDDLYTVSLSVVSIRSDLDIVAARMAARDVARKIGFYAIDQARIATIASELSRNIVMYAGEGTLRIEQIVRDDMCGIQMVFEDHGPGISDLDSLLHNGSVTQPHPLKGLGLHGSRRLLDEMHVETRIGEGTTITCRKWLRD